MSVNKAILLGNVGSDPKLYYPTPETAYAKFTLATSRRTGDVDTTEWHNIVAIGKHAQLAERYIRKGTRLYVEGMIQTRAYTDKLNIRRTITEIYVQQIEILGRQTQ